VTDFPEPDSPTMPSVEPGSTENDKPVDRGHDAVFGFECRPEVVDLEQRQTLTFPLLRIAAKPRTRRIHGVKSTRSR